MSVLARLLARSTGVEKSGLAPRLPARFETVRGAWDAEPETETKTSTAPQPVSPATAEVRPESDSTVHVSSPVATDRLATPAPLLPRAPHPAPQADLGPPEAPPAPSPPASMHPTQTDDTRPGRQSPPQHPADPVTRPGAALPASDESRIGRNDPPPATPRAPPTPLQPPVTGEIFAQVDPARPAPRPGPVQFAPTTRQSAPEPPDIVIHIGRLDISAPAQPPQPVPALKQPRDRKMTRLGDYLKPNGRSGEGRG